MPVDAHHGDIGGGVADGGQLPIDDGIDARTGSPRPQIDQGVVDPVVAVDHARGFLNEFDRGQAVRQFLRQRVQVGHADMGPLPGPAPDLTLGVPRRRAEIAKPNTLVVDGV